jgi:predicted DNA-binding protein YlxM (UPF0122 family)
LKGADFYMNFERYEKRGFSLKELAEQVPLSVAFLRKEIKRGKLKSRKYGDRVVVLSEDWDNYLIGGDRNRAETKN